MKTPKLITIGIDGGAFELISPWLDKKELPNFKYMIDNGIAGDLISCLPPVTCPNWRCYSTGKNPGKIGMFWWRNINVQDRSMILPLSSSKKFLDFWTLLSNDGYRTAVINTPLTYPPQPINGYVIAGGPDASDYKFCYPESLVTELSSKFGYRVHSRNSVDFRHGDHTVKDILALIESRFKVAEYLMEKDELDFVQVTSFYINVLQHFLWNAEPVKEGWKIIDKWLGRFLEKGTNIMIMSDHGSMPVDVSLLINCWLEEKGFLVLKKTFAEYLGVLGVNRERLNFLLDALKLRRVIKKNVPSTWKDFIPTRDGRLRGEGGLHKVEWEKSSAFGLGQGPLYMLLDKRHDAYQTRIEEIASELQALTFPGSKKKIAKDVKRADTIYHGPFMEFSPDLVIDYNHGVQIAGIVGKKEIFSKPSLWKADNKREGFFLAYGPDMEKNLHAKSLSILDLAPTILHLFDVAISEDMDGKVRQEFFAKDSQAAHRDVKIVQESDLISEEEEYLEDDKITQRLKDLGYLD